MFHLVERYTETYEESCWGQSLSLCSVWRGFHLKEPVKETHKDAYFGESMTLWSVWQGPYFLVPIEQWCCGQFISLCLVWPREHLQKVPKETYEDSYWGDFNVHCIAGRLYHRIFLPIRVRQTVFRIIRICRCSNYPLGTYLGFWKSQFWPPVAEIWLFKVFRNRITRKIQFCDKKKKWMLQKKLLHIVLKLGCPSSRHRWPGL